MSTVRARVLIDHLHRGGRIPLGAVLELPEREFRTLAGLGAVAAVEADAGASAPAPAEAPAEPSAPTPAPEPAPTRSRRRAA